MPIALTVCALALALGLLAVVKSPLPAPSWVLIALGLYTAFQAVPLPAGLVSAIAPDNAHVWNRALTLLDGTPPRWISLSLDPGASWLESLKWLAYASLFAAGAVVGRRRGAAFGVWLAFGCALAVAMVALTHGLARATSLYGFYVPTFAAPRWGIAPLLNTNNLAGYLNYGMLAGLAGLLCARNPAARVGVGLGVALLLGVSVLAASRGALLVLPLALIAFAVGVRKVGDKRRFVHSLLVAGATLAGGMTLAVLAASRGTWSEILQKGADKLRIVEWTRPMIADHAVLGVGRGAFETVFPAYGSPDRNLLYAHAENVVAQWLVEWGVPVAVGGALALIWTLKPGRTFLRGDVYAIGLGAGAIAVAVHNLFDLALEVPGYCFVVFASLGVAWGARAQRVDFGPPAPRLAGAALVGGAVLAAALTFSGSPAQAERRQLASRFDASPTEYDRLLADISAALRRHPADPYFARLIAAVHFRRGVENPLPWLSLALERDITSGRSHYLLASVLAQRGALDQALLELRLAVSNEPGLAQQVAWLASKWTRSVERLERAVPPGPAGANVYFQLAATFTAPADRAQRVQLLKRAIDRAPDWVEPRVALSRALLHAVERDEEPCVGARATGCAETIRLHATALQRLAPSSVVALELTASLLTAQGKPDDALRELERGCAGHDDAVGCHKARVRAAVAASPGRLDGALSDLMASACPPAPRCAEVGIWVGDLLTQRGQPARATIFFRKACGQSPSELCFDKLARAASRAGLHAEAVDALERLGRLRGKDAALRARIEAERTLGLKNAQTGAKD